MLEFCEIDADRAYPPRRTAFTSRFWDALVDGLFVTAACTACKKLTFPPKPICPHCWSDAMDWRTLSGRGTLYSSTVIHAAPAVFAAEAPIPVGIVDLDEGVRLATRLVAKEGRLPALDEAVEMVVLRYRDGPLFGARAL